MNASHRPPHIDSSDALADRLRTGEQLIDAETDPGKRQRLEDHWLQLLGTYEAAVDQERAAVSQMPFVMAEPHQEGAPA